MEDTQADPLIRAATQHDRFGHGPLPPLPQNLSKATPGFATASVFVSMVMASTLS